MLEQVRHMSLTRLLLLCIGVWLARLTVINQAVIQWTSCQVKWIPSPGLMKVNLINQVHTFVPGMQGVNVKFTLQKNDHM